jgi:thiamine biosynthesis lipoprotein
MSRGLPLLAAVAGLGIAGTSLADPLAVRREYVMGTIAEVRVHAVESGVDPDQAVEAAMGEIHAVDRLMAVQRPDSDVSRANRGAATRPVSVDHRVVEVLRASRHMSDLTDGAFDVTVLPTVRAWGFLDGRPRRPSTAPRPAGYRRVRVDEARDEIAFDGDDVGIDLGGIAKGYALDRARSALLRRGVRCAYLDLGGNVATLGTAPDGRPWRFGIRHPRRSDALIGMIEVGEASVSTSGDAERFVEDEQGRAGHVIDPHTGRPADALVSATVVASSAMLADGLSTAAVVMGREAFADLLPRVGGEAVLVSFGPDGQLVSWVSPGLQLHITPPVPAAAEPTPVH